MVLLEMAKIGADLRKPHEPDFMFELDAQRNAQAMEKNWRGSIMTFSSLRLMKTRLAIKLSLSGRWSLNFQH